jgi:hypothetical protein
MAISAIKINGCQMLKLLCDSGLIFSKDNQKAMPKQIATVV